MFLAEYPFKRPPGKIVGEKIVREEKVLDKINTRKKE
jgi:hypothetical protein